MNFFFVGIAQIKRLAESRSGKGLIKLLKNFVSSFFVKREALLREGSLGIKILLADDGALSYFDLKFFLRFCFNLDPDSFQR